MDIKKFVAPLAALLPLTLVACNAGESSEDSRPTVTQTVTKPRETPTSERASESSEPSTTSSSSKKKKKTKGKNPKLTTIPLKSLSNSFGGEYHFAVGPEGAGTECIYKNSALTCLATPGDSVPNLEDIPGDPWAPFTGRPGSFTLNSSGIRWGVMEGMPPTTARLEVGERVEFKNGYCKVPDKETFQCKISERNLKMSLPDKRVVKSPKDITETHTVFE